MNDIFSDDDEEIIEYITSDLYSLNQKTFAERSDLYSTLRNEDFHNRFRLNKESVLFLLRIIEEKLEYTSASKNQAVSPMNQLLCTLRFFATGSQLINSGDIIGVHESTACRIIHKVTNAIAQLSQQFICMPTTEKEQGEAVLNFYNIAQFPQVIGAIGCTHVRIKSPGGKSAEIYKIRKGYHSIKVQAICSADLMFNDVVATSHGTAHNSQIWNNCDQRDHFMQGSYQNYSLLGDNTYAQTSFMMTPFQTVTTENQSLYNESQIQTKNTIKSTFGAWKRRFPIVSREIQVRLSRIPDIIIATCVLHNIAKLQNDPEPPLDVEYPPTSDSDAGLEQTSSGSSSMGDTMGEQARQILVEKFFSF